MNPAPTFSRQAATTLTEQLAQHYAQRIRNHLLAPGAKLPSVRLCATQHGVNPSTVVAAYDVLMAQGLLVTQRNRGYFVRDTAQSPRPNVLNPAPEKMVSFSAASLIRNMLNPTGASEQPAMGVLPAQWLHNDALNRTLRKIASSSHTNDCTHRYGNPWGDLHLRHVLSQRLRQLGLPSDENQIITTVGATHALDIVCRTILQAGDAVMVDEPGWSVEFARLHALGMRILPVPRGLDGPDVNVIEQYAQTHQAKLLVTVSVLHNPTGTSLGPACAHRILQAAHKYNFHIMEDDTYGHFAPEHATRLSVLDGLQRCFYVSGFSKILAPSWRVGFVQGPAQWGERLLDTKLLSSLTTPSLFERTLADFMENGLLHRHAERLKLRLDQARQRSVQLAHKAGCRFVTPAQGLFGWVDTGCDTEVLAQHLYDHDVLIAPGCIFHAHRQPSTFMRVNFCAAQEASFWNRVEAVRDRIAQ